MLHQTTKKVVRQALILLITINLLPCILLAQSDSAGLKKEIIELLKKHGYSSFQINVNSYNQKGGQTAFSITNNYLDPNYCADSINYELRFYYKKNKFVVNPKKGTWSDLFAICPDTFFSDAQNLLTNCDGDETEISSTGNAIVSYMGSKYKCIVKSIRGSDCSYGLPYCIPSELKNSFFIPFGVIIMSFLCGKYFIISFLLSLLTVVMISDNKYEK